MVHSGKVSSGSEEKKTKNDWPIIMYDQSRSRSAQDLLYQVISKNCSTKPTFKLFQKPLNVFRDWNTALPT
jgi:hypothetical protein